MEILAILIVAVIAGSACFSGMEAAIFAVSLARAKVLREQKARGARRLVRVKEKMSRPIAVIVIFNNLFNIVGSIFVGAVATNILGSALLGVVSAVMTLLIIVFGEIVPKTIGENHAERISRLVAGPLLIASHVLAPLIWILEKTTSRFTKPKKIVSEEELQILSQLGHLEGSIEKDERDMIKKVFALNDLSAKDIMTPRTVIAGFPSTKTLGQLAKKIQTMPYSRIPVYDRDLDNILGICHQQDLLVALCQGKQDSLITDFVKKAMFVKEDMRVDHMLPLFQRKRQHLAIVKDEFDGTSGVVTLEDAVEQLVGEIMDETDKHANLRKTAREKNDNKKAKN